MHYRPYSIYSLTSLYKLQFLQNYSACTVNTFKSGACGGHQGILELSVAKSYCEVTRSILDPISSLYKRPTLQFRGMGSASLCVSTPYKMSCLGFTWWYLGSAYMALRFSKLLLKRRKKQATATEK